MSTKKILKSKERERDEEIEKLYYIKEFNPLVLTENYREKQYK